MRYLIVKVDLGLFLTCFEWSNSYTGWSWLHWQTALQSNSEKTDPLDPHRHAAFQRMHLYRPFWCHHLQPYMTMMKRKKHLQMFQVCHHFPQAQDQISPCQLFLYLTTDFCIRFVETFAFCKCVVICWFWKNICWKGENIQKLRYAKLKQNNT